MSGTTDLRRDPAYWCDVHRRYLPYGRSTCLLCELESNDRLDTFAAERRKRLVDYFPKGRVAKLIPPLPPKPDRF